MLGWMDILRLTIFSGMLVAGQVMFKYVAINFQTSPPNLNDLSTIVSVPLILALTIYGGATVLWIWILVDTPLSKAYPFSLLGAAIVPVVAYYFFGENISTSYVFGFILILGGLYLCVR